jgi:FkbM family methyltransferase
MSRHSRGTRVVATRAPAPIEVPVTEAAAPTATVLAPPRRGGWRARLGNALYIAASRVDWAEPEIEGLAQVVKPGDTVLDIGAGLGMYTVPLSYLIGPTGRIDSVDPQPRNFHVVRFLRVLVGTSRGRLRRVAMGPNAGVGEIVVPIHGPFPIFGHGHLRPVGMPSARRVHRIRTDIDTIDAWVEREGLAHVAFIKIDVEGFEPSVVAGARQVIDRDRPSLLLEIEDRHLARYDRAAAEFLAEIAERWPEYRMYIWADGSWAPAAGVRPEVRNYLFTTEVPS